jgi:hypothetical protein
MVLSRIDHILYINLEHRFDRRIEIELELSKLPFTFERVDAIKTNPGIIGCGQSHLKCLKIAKERGYRGVWIFEDDFTFTMPIADVMKTLKGIMSNIDVILGAYNLVGCDVVAVDDGMLKGIDVQTASCYIVFEHYYDTMIANLEEGNAKLVETGEHWNYANDQYWKRLQKGDCWMCVNPRFGIQRASYSDNSECFMDHGV